MGVAGVKLFVSPAAVLTVDNFSSIVSPAGFLSVTDAAFGPDVAAAVAGRYPTGLSRASARSRQDLMVAIFGTDSGSGDKNVVL